MTTRRQFLKTGLAGGLLLNLAACRRPAENGGRSSILKALVPVLLAGALPDEAKAAEMLVARTISGVDRAIAGLSLTAQKEIGELFDLLAFTPTRILAAGLWSSWDEATPEALVRFLESWRHSRFDLLKSGYAALHDLILGAWYARPETWGAIGYPGPPRVH